MASNDTSDNMKSATGKGDDKDEPMEVDTAAEKDDKSSKSGSKSSESNGSVAATGEAKTNTKEPASATASS